MFKTGETVKFRTAYDEWKTGTYMDELKSGGYLVKTESGLIIAFIVKKINTLYGVKPGQPVLVWDENDEKKSIDVFVEIDDAGLVDCEEYKWDNAERLPNYDYDSGPLDMDVE